MAKLFGKKQEGATQDAAISSIPVPPSDSALVIDLPEGQKLVIGKMEEGTVIEVATWRGTGRPDSRTNRLMLGVSFGGTQTPEPERQRDDLDLSELPAYKKYLYLIRQVTNIAIKRLSQMIEKLRSLLEKGLLKLKRQKELSVGEPVHEISTSPTSDEDFDIDKWLDSLRSNSRVSKLAEVRATPAKSSTELGRSTQVGRGKHSVPKSRTSRTKRPASKKKPR